MSPGARRAGIAALLILIVFFAWRWLTPAPTPPPEIAEEAPELELTETTPVAPTPKATPKPTPPVDLSVPPNLEKNERARRIRSEIKVSLSGLYAAEKAFFSESGRYSTDFDVVGWMPTSQKLSAKVGFLYPYQPPQDEFRDRMDRYDTDQAVEASKSFEDPDSYLTYQDSALRVTLQNLSSYCEMNCTADARGFEAIAAANLDDDDELDIWRINDKKELVHLFDDVEGRVPLTQKPEIIPASPEDSFEPANSAEPPGADENSPLPPVDLPTEMGPPGGPQPDEVMPSEEVDATPEDAGP